MSFHTNGSYYVMPRLQAVLWPLVGKNRQKSQIPQVEWKDNRTTAAQVFLIFSNSLLKNSHTNEENGTKIVAAARWQSCTTACKWGIR